MSAIPVCHSGIPFVTDILLCPFYYLTYHQQPPKVVRLTAFQGIRYCVRGLTQTTERSQQYRQTILCQALTR